MIDMTKAADNNPHLHAFERLREEIAKVVVGQQDLVDRLILAMLCNGHVLIEGIPGLAKTLTVNTLARCMGVSFSRIQFTPDLLPGDLTGTMIYHPGSGKFDAHKGPIFANIVLADEINRSPAKVQSALLEAMQERQVSLGGEVHLLPKPFLVLATQNPVEQEGTYPLPEAQVDRFMFKLKVDYPSFDEEHEILKRMSKPEVMLNVKEAMSGAMLLEIRAQMENIHIDESIEEYILNLVHATRNPQKYNIDIKEHVRFGASPRASINLALASKGRALMHGRDYVVPQDVADLCHDVMRHRLALTYRAEAKGLTSDDLVDRVLEKVDLP